MNTDKTEVTFFGSRHQLNHVSANHVKVPNDLVASKSKKKYLEVFLDESLSMKDHIRAKCQVAAYNIRHISMIRNFIDLDCAKMLTSSLVLTHLDYSNSALAGLPKTSLQMLKKVKN